MFKVFDANLLLDKRGVFLDLTKSFDKVSHGGLLYKLKRIRICEKCFWLIDSFLFDRFHKVLLNGQTSA